ncbi:MAG: ABC transporter substrate-binding protein [Bifidobacteriaceae bacterium]|jgi:peptide/nickel transport system substrate-binding protein|nr:ABC transporter substrate-binding protein [Bifidobacteriaceae bacterium]
MKTRSIAKRAAGAAAAVAALALLAGCGGAETPSGDQSTGAAGSPGAADPAGGALVVGVTSDVDTLFPWKATQFNTVNVMQVIYGTLTEFDQDLNVAPGIAESWEISDDRLTLTFHLRQGVKFADGSDCDSADVKFSLDKIADEATAAVARAQLSSIASVAAPDAATVVLNLTSPDAGLVSSLASINVAILSSDDTEEALNETPNGTGPFKLKERKPSQSLTLERNGNYWGDPAKLDTVEFRVIPDETSIVTAMQSGNVHLAVFDDPLVAESAETSANAVIQEQAQLAYHVLQLNATKGELTDVNVRLAIQCAIDRQQVLDAAALGEGAITGPITSPAFRSDPSARPCPDRDLDKAAEYLAKAGKADGIKLKVMVSQGEYATSVNEAQSIQAQLADAKIEVELEVLESGAYVDRWLAADFDAAVALNGGRPDPDQAYSRYFTSTGNLNAVAGFSSPELDRLFAEGRSSASKEERESIYTEISSILEDNAAWVWLFTSYTYTATTADVSGYVPMANDSMQYLRTTALG